MKASCFCAAIMNEDEDGGNVYYGRIRNLLGIVFNPDNQVIEKLPENVIQFDLAIMDRAMRLTKGLQQQIHSSGTGSAAFSNLSVEDVSVINRKIAVVDHIIPSKCSTSPTSNS